MPVKNPPLASKDAAIDSLRSGLTYANEQTAIWKNKATAEEDRARELEKKLSRLDEGYDVAVAAHARTTKRLGVLLGQVVDRDEAIVQLALRSARDGDPGQIETWRAGNVGRGERGEVMTERTAPLPGMEDAAHEEISLAALDVLNIRDEKKELKERLDGAEELLLGLMTKHKTPYYYDPDRRLLIEVEEKEKVKVTLKGGKKSDDE